MKGSVRNIIKNFNACIVVSIKIKKIRKKYGLSKYINK